MVKISKATAHAGATNPLAIRALFRSSCHFLVRPRKTLDREGQTNCGFFSSVPFESIVRENRADNKCKNVLPFARWREKARIKVTLYRDILKGGSRILGGCFRRSWVTVRSQMERSEKSESHILWLEHSPRLLSPNLIRAQVQRSMAWK